MNSKECYRSVLRMCLLAISMPALACSGCDDEGTDISADTILIDGNITEDRTLENIIEDPEVADYLVTDTNIGVSAALTVEPGVRIAFESGTSFEFQTGSLNAVGTEEEPIVFTAANGQPGGWKGLYIKSNDVTNELTWAIVEYGGQDGQPGIDEVVNLGLGNDARMKVTNSIFRHGLEYGMSTRATTDLSGFENNTFTENGEGPAVFEANSVQYIDSGSTFSGNENDYVFVTNKTMADDATWAAIDVPYRMEDNEDFTVDGAWTLEPGVTIESGTESAFIISGTVSAVGTEDAPITFTGAGKQPGAWQMLVIETNDPANELEHCVFEYSGSSATAGINEPGAVALKRSATVTVTNSTFRDNAGWGIWSQRDAVVTESGNTFENNELGDIGMDE